MDHTPQPAAPAEQAAFDTLNLHPSILQGVRDAGFTHPSPIQARAIPVILDGRDLIAQARTGTGKTAAFGLPAMHRIAEAGTPPGAALLVITPTRELASQVAQELFRLGRHAGIQTVAVYGGQSGQNQTRLIRDGAQVVVATPGRLLDHLSSGRYKKFAPTMVVLDEADEMLDMGFLDDIRAIFGFLPEREDRQTMLFSATIPPPIRRLAAEILREPVTIDMSARSGPGGDGDGEGGAANPDIEQLFYVIEERERIDAVIRLIDAEEPKKALIFCRTKRETDDLATALAARGTPARPLHGDMEQNARNNAIGAFKSGKIPVLVATDVAARGLDVSGLTHVFNFHIPFDPDAYIHRVGRTGRAGNKGKAITLVTPSEFRKLRRIGQAIKAEFTHGEVPSIADLRKRADAKLIKAICKQPVRDGAVELLAALEEEMDLTEAACKVISMLLDKEGIRGPSRIGLTREQLREFMAKPSAPAGRGGKGPPWKGGPFKGKRRPPGAFKKSARPRP